MSLPTNPLASLVAKISAELTPATNAVKNVLKGTSVGNSLDKANLDSKVNNLSGGLGTGNNWAGTAAFGKTYTPIGGGFQGGGYGSVGATGVAGAAGASAIGNKTSISSIVQKGASTVQKFAASTANSFSDINRIASNFNKLTGGNVAGTIQNLAAKISGTAGQVNNLLSMNRAQDIPKGGELFASQEGPTEIASSAETDWRVRIRLQTQATYDELLGSNDFLELIKNRNGVVWPYTPNITLSTKANYTAIDTVHSNYPFYAYKNSSIDDITISGDWSVETVHDAANWIAATLFFRAVTKMFFGQDSNAGNPPPICILDGYGASVFRNVPIIVKSFSVDFKDDVNYINYPGTNTWVPILSTISVVVAPIYSRARLRQFNMQQYVAGQMVDGQGVSFL